MAPTTKGLPHMEPLPPGMIAVAVGEVVAFPDDPDYDFDGDEPIEYGIVQAVGALGGGVFLDVLVFDSRHGVRETDSEVRRVPYPDGIQ